MSYVIWGMKPLIDDTFKTLMLRKNIDLKIMNRPYY